MIDVSSGRKRDRKSEASEIHFSGPGRANDHWRGYRNRLKIMDFPEISCGWRLLLPLFIL